MTPGFPLKLCGSISFKPSDKEGKSVLVSIKAKDSGLRGGQPFSQNLRPLSEQGFMLTSGRPPIGTPGSRLNKDNNGGCQENANIILTRPFDSGTLRRDNDSSSDEIHVSPHDGDKALSESLSLVCPEHSN